MLCNERVSNDYLWYWYIGTSVISGSPVNTLILIYRDKVFWKVPKRLYIHIMHYEMVPTIYLHPTDPDPEAAGGRVLALLHEPLLLVRWDVIPVLARAHLQVQDAWVTVLSCHILQQDEFWEGGQGLISTLTLYQLKIGLPLPERMLNCINIVQFL